MVPSITILEVVEPTHWALNRDVTFHALSTENVLGRMYENPYVRPVMAFWKPYTGCGITANG
jgi:hypothetical protein